jgi:NTP pyrophosphatase (non-canonical NTP hydrolase)
MEEKLLKIINHYGIRNQQRKLNEEVFELQEAIIDYKYVEVYKNSPAEKYHKEHIAEEIADIEVMLLQFKEYYQIDGNDILRIMNEKIDRQLGRIENENSK